MNNTLYVTTKCCTAEEINDMVLALPTDDSGSVSGLIMTPTACELCVWRGGQFEGEKIIEQAFEVRAFCNDWEFRWNREGTNGVAALLSEKQISACGWSDPSEIELEGTLNRSYLLWGERENNSQGSGWTTLIHGRTGPIQVPVENNTSRIKLKVREYLARFEHGNVCVFDQRLIALVDA